MTDTTPQQRLQAPDAGQSAAVRDLPMRLVVDAPHCARLHGGSVRDCACFLPNALGFAECPPEARRIILPTIYGDRDTVNLPAVAAAAIVPAVAAQSEGNGSPWRSPPTVTGDLCQGCGGPNMVRTGTCLTCQDCGSTSGGCS